jgi:hypothetical protein
VTTAPTSRFEDLLCVGNLFNSLANPGEWDPTTVQNFARETLPQVVEHYTSRLTQADEISKSLRFKSDGVDQQAPDYSSQTEVIYNNAKWFRGNAEKLKGNR